MNILLAAAGAAILCAVSVMVLKENGAKSIAYTVAAAGGIIITVFLAKKFIPEAAGLKGIFEYAGALEYQALMLKALGVGLLTEACAGLCRELGEAGIAGKVEFAGKLLLVVMCFPLIYDVLNISRGML